MRNDELGHRTAGIGEVPDADDGDVLKVGTERARRARRAVQGGPELALQVVVLEFGGDQEERVKGYTNEGEPPPVPTESYRHSPR